MGSGVGQLLSFCKGGLPITLLQRNTILKLPGGATPSPPSPGPGRVEEEVPLVTHGHASPLPQILISADDEMEESDVEEDLHRLTPLKPAKKKKHRFGLPV